MKVRRTAPSLMLKSLTVLSLLELESAGTLARAEAEKAVALLPSSALARLNLAQLLLAGGVAWKRSLALLRELSSLPPSAWAASGDGDVSEEAVGTVGAVSLSSSIELRGSWMPPGRGRSNWAVVGSVPSNYGVV